MGAKLKCICFFSEGAFYTFGTGAGRLTSAWKSAGSSFCEGSIEGQNLAALKGLTWGGRGEGDISPLKACPSGLQG